MGLVVILNVVSCYVLGDSFKRMVSLSEQSRNLIVNYKMMYAHIVSYAMFIISWTLYLASSFGLKSTLTSTFLDLYVVLSCVS